VLGLIVIRGFYRSEQDSTKEVLRLMSPRASSSERFTTTCFLRVEDIPVMGFVKTGILAAIQPLLDRRLE
jgi:hypothetical protein